MTDFYVMGNQTLSDEDVPLVSTGETAGPLAELLEGIRNEGLTKELIEQIEGQNAVEFEIYQLTPYAKVRDLI